MEIDLWKYNLTLINFWILITNLIKIFTLRFDFIGLIVSYFNSKVAKVLHLKSVNI